MSNYIYGVIQSEREKNFGPIGIAGGDEVYTILYRDLAPVVSDSLPPALTALATEEVLRYLFAHQSVIEKVMNDHTVIPFKFGTTASSSEEVGRILERGYANLKDALKSMEGKVELDVVATWNKDLAFKDISREEEIIKFKQGLGPQPSSEDKVKLGRIVEAFLTKRKGKLAAEIIDALSQVALDFCLHDTAGAAMIINGAFLIPMERLEDFDQRLEEIDKRHEGRLNFRRLGPLPPYSFSTIEVKKAEFGEIDKAICWGWEGRLRHPRSRRLTGSCLQSTILISTRAMVKFKKGLKIYLKPANSSGNIAREKDAPLERKMSMILSRST